ncbi:MAG: DUF3362 domain-containing protein, partial [Nanobdellota archaeon]
ILEIARRISRGLSLYGVAGTCVASKTLPSGFKELPSFKAVKESKKKFCEFHNLLSNLNNLAQKIDNRYILQFRMPHYTSKDLDEYYELPFSRNVPPEMSGFEFSVVTHRGCIGRCNFCSITLTQGDKIISRSEKSILREIKRITKLSNFRGNIDNLAGPSAEMYGMDCRKCLGACIDCSKLNKSGKPYISLLKKARRIKGVKNVFVRTGIRHDLCSEELLKELAKFHVSGRLRIAPEHVNQKVLSLMNKNRGDWKKFLSNFRKYNKSAEVSFYFLAAHPGCGMVEARELAKEIKKLKAADDVQIFTPTPMSTSTCMYYTSIDPVSMKTIYVPYSYREKKIQKRLLYE